MTDDTLRELERRWRLSGSNDDGRAYAHELERAGRKHDGEMVLEHMIGDLRDRLNTDENTSQHRKGIAELNPYAWTGFIAINRAEDHVALSVYERVMAHQPRFTRTFATKGRTHVLSCGDTLYIIDKEKEIALGAQRHVRDAPYCVPVTCVNHYAQGERNPPTRARQVDCYHAGWVGGDTPLRFFQPFNGVSIFHSQGESTLNVTGTSLPGETLAGNVLIADEKVLFVTPGEGIHPALRNWQNENWREYHGERLESTQGRFGVRLPYTSRAAIGYNRANTPARLTSLHATNGDTLLVEAPITILDILHSLPEHVTTKRKGMWSWEDI